MTAVVIHCSRVQFEFNIIQCITCKPRTLSQTDIAMFPLFDPPEWPGPTIVVHWEPHTFWHPPVQGLICWLCACETLTMFFSCHCKISMHSQSQPKHATLVHEFQQIAAAAQTLNHSGLKVATVCALMFNRLHSLRRWLQPASVDVQNRHVLEIRESKSCHTRFFLQMRQHQSLMKTIFLFDLWAAHSGPNYRSLDDPDTLSTSSKPCARAQWTTSLFDSYWRFKEISVQTFSPAMPQVWLGRFEGWTEALLALELCPAPGDTCEACVSPFAWWSQ